MSEIAYQIREIESNLKNAKHYAELFKCLQQLENNPAFIKLIHEEFFLHEAARYVQQSSNPGLNPQQREDALSIAQSSGHLQRFFAKVGSLGSSSQEAIVAYEQELEILRSEV